jgi:hypothetical protein
MGLMVDMEKSVMLAMSPACSPAQQMSHVTFTMLPSKWGTHRKGNNKLQPQTILLQPVHCWSDIINVFTHLKRGTA